MAVLKKIIILVLLSLPCIIRTVLSDNVDEACGTDKYQRIRIMDKGHIFSPGYKEGKNYPLKTTCSYYLHTKPGMKVRIKFVDFDLESTEFCIGDSLKIYEGSDEYGVINGEFCGNILPRDVLSLNNELYITLTSDFMITAKGFHLTYESTYDETLCPNEVACLNRKCGVAKSAVCDGIDDCGDGTDEQNCGYPVINFTRCGQPTIQPAMDLDERIVGGHEAIPGSWPWQADLQLNIVEPNGHICGGSLINDQWIVTASHCVIGKTDPGLWRIHLGNHHKFKIDHSEQVRYPERLVIYDWPEDLITKFKFNPSQDITLIKLNAPVKFTDKVQPVCLPPDSIKVDPGTECYVTGWGETRGTGKSENLKQTKLIIQEWHHCISSIAPYNDKSMICAGIMEGQHGPCHGDSGGPLVCKINRKWMLIGISSFITETNKINALCAIRNVSSVFMRISYWKKWIHETIEKYS